MMSSSGFKPKDKATAKFTAKTNIEASFGVGGWYIFVCKDADGNVKWTERIHNLFTNEGLNDILDVYFSDGTQDTTHYIGLKGTGAPAAGDTLASHASWTEFTSYTGDRQAWVEGGVTGQSITNSGSPATFSLTGDGTIAGSFLTNVNTGTGGVLVCVVNFTTSRGVASGDSLESTYTVSAVDA